MSLAIEKKGFAKPATVFTRAFQHRLLNFLYAVPNGVISMSQTVPDLVQTSTNLAIVETDSAHLRVVTSQRSAMPSELEDISDTICALGEQVGAHIDQGNGYPAWKPNLDSPLLDVATMVYKSLFKKAPDVKAVHAGLECGIIGDRFSGMDMISFGPTILGAHSPTERVQISTVEKFWNFLVALLRQLAG